VPHITFATIVLASLLLPAIAVAQGTPAGEPTDIPPVVWELQTLSTGAEQLTPPNPAAYTVQFLSDGELRVRADCNRGIGDYTLDGSSITIGPIGLTRMGCPAGSLDGRFMEALSRAAVWSFQDDLLILDAPADSGSLAFAPALTGVVWEWQGFAGGDGSTVTPDDPTAYTIAFVNESELALRADCNQGRGAWTADPPQIDLTPGAITVIGCEEGSLDGRFLTDLDQVSSFVFREGLLYLALPMDAGIHAFAGTPPTIDATPAAGS
jgi:heat shock protein HslJ